MHFLILEGRVSEAIINMDKVVRIAKDNDDLTIIIITTTSKEVLNYESIEDLNSTWSYLLTEIKAGRFK